MDKIISAELLPYFNEYKELLQVIEQDQETIGFNESFITDHLEGSELDPLDDPTIRLFGEGISDASQEINECSNRLNEIDKFLKENGMVGLIYQSRLNAVKRIAELEKKFPEWEKLEQAKAKKIADYVKKDSVSEDNAEIMLKVGDKKFRADCLKLSEKDEYYRITDVRYVLERMEMRTTSMLVPEDMLPAKVNGKGMGGN